jgi:hypothetical protein
LELAKFYAKLWERLSPGISNMTFVPFTVQHTMDWKKGGFVSIRHNESHSQTFSPIKYIYDLLIVYITFVSS